MKLSLVLSVASVVTPHIIVLPLAHAAEITDVPDAVDVLVVGGDTKQDPFDMYVGPDFSFEWSKGRITREPIDVPGIVNAECNAGNSRGCLPLDELNWKRSDFRLNIRGEVGMYHDLALTINLPIILTQELSFGYANGVNSTNSTVDTGTPDSTLFANDFESSHRGVGKLELGLKWAALNDERDDTKPVWLLFFRWAMPWTADVYDPATFDIDKGAVGDGVHDITFGTSLSKRLANFGIMERDTNANRRGFTDPYVEVAFTFPVISSDANSALRKNARTNPFGEKPAQRLTINFGMEAVPYEDVSHHRKIAVDLGLRTMFVTDGRNYSLLTDPLGELTFEQQHFKVGGLLGIYAQLAEFLRVRLAFGVSFVSEHYLTFETVGKDVDGDGQILPGTDDLLNPYFCGNDPNGSFGIDNCAGRAGIDPYDQVGARFRAERQVVYNLNATVFATF